MSKTIHIILFCVFYLYIYKKKTFYNIIIHFLHFYNTDFIRFNCNEKLSSNLYKAINLNCSLKSPAENSLEIVLFVVPTGTTELIMKDFES